MKMLFATLALAASAMSPQLASAQENELGLGWACALRFSGVSQGAQLIIGKFKTEAVGTMSCGNAQGERQERAVRVVMKTKWIAPSIGAGYFEFTGASAQISLLNSNPEVLFGDYIIAQGQIAVIGGVSAMTAIKVGSPQLAVQLSIQANHGIGAQLGFNRMTIEPL